MEAARNHLALIQVACSWLWLNQGVSRAIAADPAWSPDSSSLVFTREGEGGRDLWQVRLVDGASRPLLEDPGSDMPPSWAP